MSVSSMTGFARAAGADAARRWAWEARSVNGRGLDLRLRLPPGYDRFDAPARAAASRRFQRGSVTLSLAVERTAAELAPRVNRARLAEYAAIARDVAAESGLASARVDGLMALRGVIEAPDAAEADAGEDAPLLADLEAALDALARVRAAEGAATATVLGERLDEIERLTRDAATLAATQPATLRTALETRLADLLGASPAPSPERLAAEIALLATKADVREELDRLAAHVAQARGLLAAGGAAGRKLEFLAQEFNREANTLCSKSADLALTRLGLDLKTAIDRLREQAANVE